MAKKKNRTAAQKAALALLWLFLIAMLLFILVQFFIIFHNPYRTETALLSTMSDSVTVKGVAVFDAVEVPGSGEYGYLVQDGERVTGGSVIAEQYDDSSQGILRERLDRLARNIDLLNRSQTATASDLNVLTNQTRQALYSLLDCLDTAEYSGIAQAEDEYLLAQNRLQVSTGQATSFAETIQELQAEHDEIEQQLSALPTVQATQNGYFISTEAAPRIRPDGEQLAAAAPLELQQALEQGFPEVEGEQLGQIVTGFSWLFYGSCDLATADQLEGLSTVQISVPGKQHTPLSAQVNELVRDEENGVAKLVLECQTINANVLSFGVENLKIDLYTYEGIRIERSAMHIVDGARGVYVKYGNLQRFLKITTLYENENYLLIPPNGALGSENEVRLYDEIIVEGSNLRDGRLL